MFSLTTFPAALSNVANTASLLIIIPLLVWYVSVESSHSVPSGIIKGPCKKFPYLFKSMPFHFKIF